MGAGRGFLRPNGRVRHLGYTRVSTSGQDAKLQLDALAAVGVQKRDVFADVTSGSKTAIARPGMKKLLAYVEPGDTVVVWRVDRLGRSLIDVLNTMNLLRERGVYLRSISDGIDPTTTSGRLMLNMLATLAEYERELIVERVNAGIAAAGQGGTRFGRPLSDPVVIADKLRIAYMSALIYGLLMRGGDGLAPSVLEALGRMASKAAAITVRRPGAHPPTSEELRAELPEHQPAVQ